VTSRPLFEVDDLRKWFPTRGTGFLSNLLSEPTYLRAVDDVLFDIYEGEILGVAGQSGCGKSTLGELLLGLQSATDGSIRFRGRDITDFDNGDMRSFRQECQIVFQDPYESLNPRFTVARMVSEPLVINDIGGREEQDARTIEALEDAGLRPAEKYLGKLPSELSGGERQRVSIARALVISPSFIVADEPVSMLDVSVRTGLLHLFEDLQEKRDFTMMYISHDLSTINYLADRTMIMFLGNVIELGPTEDVITDPAHPYTKALLQSVPNSDPDERTRGGEEADALLEGEIPDAVSLADGCRFSPWCKHATEECSESEPDLAADAGAESGGREVACYHPVNE